MRIPELKSPRSQWSEWVESEYPFDPAWERHLQTRQPHQRAGVGSAEELHDLRGIRDRVLCADLAIMWAGANRNSAFEMRRNPPETRQSVPIPGHAGFKRKRQDESAIPPMPDYDYQQHWQDDAEQGAFDGL